jgi:predicted transcriptional regulator
MSRPAGADGILQDALQRLGAKRIEATLLASLLQHGPQGTKEIVDQSGLRQPEVSVGMHILRDRGWVDVAAIPRSGKGRPMHRYELTVGAPAILRRFEATDRQAIDDVKQALQVLRQQLR